MKNLSSLNLILLFILCIISVTFIVTILKQNYNHNNNNINQGIENSINRIIGMKEGFQTQNDNKYNNNNNKTGQNASAAIDNGLELITTMSPQEETHIESLTDNDTNEPASLDDMFTNLTSLEEKCSEYEIKQQDNDDREKKRHEEFIQEQLDIENVKINELTEIVNFYRKKYHEKMSVNSECRKNKFNILENTMDGLNKVKEDDLNTQDVYLKFNNKNKTPVTTST
jgi:hypothetical protein